MSLQEELKQGRPFAHPSTEALIAIQRTAAILEHGIQEILRPFGVTPTQYNVLRILRGAGENGLCGREVGERLVAQVPDVSRLLDRMDEMGLLTRERDEDDRRHVTARITAKGRRTLTDAQPALEAEEQRLFEGVPEGTISALIAGLDAVRNRR